MTRCRHQLLVPAAPTHGLPHGALPTNCLFTYHDLPNSSARVLAVASVEELRRG